jgi:hypothetical protein
MNTLSQALIAAITATHDADAQDLISAAKAIFQSEPNDATDVAMDMLNSEATERLEIGDAPDPMLHDVLAIVAEYFNPT